MKPSEAVQQGICPSCLGTGKVYRFVPVEGEYRCHLCGSSGQWPPPVVMLDLRDLTLHRPSHVHLITLCGVQMIECQVGPADALTMRAQHHCPECWRA